MIARRVISGLLSLAMASSLCVTGLPAASAADGERSVLQAQQATGSIGLTLRFDLPQRVEEVKDRDIKLKLTGTGTDITVSLKDGTAAGADGLNVSVEAQNALGAPLTTEQQLGA